MGREIRRVPPNWQHPKHEAYRPYAKGGPIVEEYKPLLNETYASAKDEWERGLVESGLSEEEYLDDCGGPPEAEDYVPYTREQATWYQVYETVSEGTPVTPPFETKDELVKYLALKGDFWDQTRIAEGRQEGPPGWGFEAAQRFVESEWAPSMIMENGVLKTPRDGI